MIAQGGEEVQVEVQQMFSHRGTFIPEDSGKKSKRRLERRVRLDREKIRRENPALNLVGEEDEDNDEKVGGGHGGHPLRGRGIPSPGHRYIHWWVFQQ